MKANPCCVVKQFIKVFGINRITFFDEGKLNEGEGYFLNSLRIAEKSDLEGEKVENYNYLSN